MATKVIGINCLYSSSLVEIPFNEKAGVKSGDQVVFKDIDGKEEYGVVKFVEKDAVFEENVLSASKILRQTTANDIQKVESHMVQGDRALDVCKKLIGDLNLEMAVFKAKYSFDGNKISFLFTADERVDFRDLVKDLAMRLKKQIHLRQIGPRDKAKLIGGYGKCGRNLCCSSFLEKMESINMEMVRDQGLEGKGSSKLSGACSKLLCCLKYEVDAYRDLRKGMPEISRRVKTKKGEGIVIALDILNQKAKVLFENNESMVLDVKEIDKVIK